MKPLKSIDDLWRKIEEEREGSETESVSCRTHEYREGGVIERERETREKCSTFWLCIWHRHNFRLGSSSNRSHCYSVTLQASVDCSAFVFSTSEVCSAKSRVWDAQVRSHENNSSCSCDDNYNDDGQRPTVCSLRENHGGVLPEQYLLRVLLPQPEIHGHVFVRLML